MAYILLLQSFWNTTVYPLQTAALHCVVNSIYNLFDFHLNMGIRISHLQKLAMQLASLLNRESHKRFTMLSNLNHIWHTIHKLLSNLNHIWHT